MFESECLGLEGLAGSAGTIDSVNDLLNARSTTEDPQDELGMILREIQKGGQPDVTETSVGSPTSSPTSRRKRRKATETRFFDNDEYGAGVDDAVTYEGSFAMFGAQRQDWDVMRMGTGPSVMSDYFPFAPAAGGLNMQDFSSLMTDTLLARPEELNPPGSMGMMYGDLYSGADPLMGVLGGRGGVDGVSSPVIQPARPTSIAAPVSDPLRRLNELPFPLPPPPTAAPLASAAHAPPTQSDEASLESVGSGSTAGSMRDRKKDGENQKPSKYLKKGELKGLKNSKDGVSAPRPELNEQHVNELNDITEFRQDERALKHIVDYHENISFALGEGGRELLRACLNVKGCKGRQLQGASVPSLLSLAKTWGLWDLTMRIKIERSTGHLCPQHEAFVRFKANQSQMRKYIKKEYMVTERDKSGKISKIVYDENRKITLGKEGREALRALLRRLHDKHATKMDELLERNGFKYSELRNATVQQLSRMAFVCNLWDQVVHACRRQEEKRESRPRGEDEPVTLPMPLQLPATCKTERPTETGEQQPAAYEQPVPASEPETTEDTLAVPYHQYDKTYDDTAEGALGAPLADVKTEIFEEGSKRATEVEPEDFIRAYAPAFIPEGDAQEMMAGFLRGTTSGGRPVDEDAMFQAIMNMVPFDATSDPTSLVGPMNIDVSKQGGMMSDDLFSSTQSELRYGDDVTHSQEFPLQF